MLQFVRYCQSMGYQLQDETALVSWIFHARESLHRKKNTLLAKIQAYKWCHAVVWQLGEVNNTRGSMIGLLERCVERLAEDRVPKLAVSKAQLKSMLERLELIVPENRFKELRAWWCLSYTAFLRCSEVARIKWSDIEIERWTDGRVSAINLCLTVRDREVFKTDNASVKLRLLRAPSTMKETCPVLTVCSWMAVAVGSGTQRLFESEVGLVRARFQETAITALGGSKGQYGLHSLRAGAATDAEAEGKCLSEIMFQGRWRSATVLQYMRNGEQQARMLGTSVRGLRDVRVVQG